MFSNSSSYKGATSVSSMSEFNNSYINGLKRNFSLVSINVTIIVGFFFSPESSPRVFVANKESSFNAQYSPPNPPPRTTTFFIDDDSFGEAFSSNADACLLLLLLETTSFLRILGLVKKLLLNSIETSAMVMIDDACSFSRVKSSLTEMTYTTDVFVKNSLVTSADVYCDIIHGVFFVPVVFKILVIREQRRGEQHHEWWQRDEE